MDSCIDVRDDSERFRSRCYVSPNDSKWNHATVIRLSQVITRPTQDLEETRFVLFLLRGI